MQKSGWRDCDDATAGWRRQRTNSTLPASSQKVLPSCWGWFHPIDATISGDYVTKHHDKSGEGDGDGDNE